MNSLSRRSFLEKFSMGIGSSALAVNFPILLSDSHPANKIYDGRKLNVALVGLGNYARILAEGMKESRYCQLAGIVTGHPEKAKQWQQEYDIPAENIYNYQDFDRIKENKNIDIVYVVTPNGLHKEYVLRAAKAGKQVITEKPMATSVKDCEEMIRACKEAGVQLAVGYRLHYEPTHLEIKRMGQEKVFGQVRMIEAGLGYKTYDSSQKGLSSSNFNIYDQSEWRLNKVLSGGGPLLDLGIYCVQCCRYVLGEEPVSVTGQFGTIHNKTRFAEVEESITWQMQFPSGAISNCTTSYGFNIDRFYAAADEGFFEMSPGLSYGPFNGMSSKGKLDFPVTNQQAIQMDEIGRLMLENKKLPSHITGEEGIKDIRIIYAVYEAAKTGKKISLK